MTINNIKTVLIIGSGTMGQHIGFQCAISGYDVNMYDISQEALDMAKERMGKLSRNLIRSGLTEEAAGSAFKRISNHHGCSDCRTIR